ncbi:DUF4127 family protein [Pectinatus brassicae]|uniref:DUF4127 family protein n=1 Tax=Pectinatus brassicae TaxID=862415 RepID=A0A840URW8_9FIRM|nr:DUF4127 family protein [Pectinatus brassicae]MBB5336892.1 hypothetical protein [Pectinatus brassicae]
MKYIINYILLAVLAVFLLTNTAFAQFKKTILFVPHDNRPISFHQTVDNIRALGYNVITPPENLIGNRDDLGHPEELADWVLKNAYKADYAVLSSDALVYGSLVASRKHDLTIATCQKRAQNAFDELHQKYPYLPIYVFSSIMRTPQTSAASSEEPEYYRVYGTSIARYTALLDKQEKDGLTGKEEKELKTLKAQIPAKDLQDWMLRRAGNFTVNKYLVDLVKNKDISYLILGCDDNAEYSQTDRERRLLDTYAGDINGENYQSVAGLDELALLMMTRAVNQMKGDIPFISVHYAEGTGGDTVPAYSNEKISASVKTHIKMAGGIEIPNDKRADFVLLVNTDKYGKTYAANELNNTITPHENTASFVDMAGKYIMQDKNVGIADIDFGNGSDNALMNMLWQKNYLSQLKAYAGWNTPTNSSGYTIGMGMLSSYANKEETMKMIVPRYLDDWFYQANIRQQVANKMDSFSGQGNYGDTMSRTAQAQNYAESLMNKAVEKYDFAKIFNNYNWDKLQVSFPWHRLFEADVIVPEKNK